ncbi:MAG: tetratricopeptide repeat protein [Candidatus Acidiferrum sp.]
MKNSEPIRQQSTASSATSPNAQESLSLRTVLIIAATLVAVVFAVYSPALHFQFILDDHRFTGDPRLQSSGHLWEYFTSFVWAQIPGGPLSFYRPLFLLWLRLNFVLSGASPWGWHLLSVAKHVSVAVLLGLLAWKLLRDRVAALMAATLFALHPAQTESVAWVTVPDPLMAAGVIGALLLYLKYRESVSAAGPPPDGTNNEKVVGKSSGKSNRKLRKQACVQPKEDYSALWLIASAAACLAALMAKETAVVLPAILFTLALLAPLGKPSAKEAPSEQVIKLGLRVRSAFLRTLPFLVVTVIYFLFRFDALGVLFSPLTQHLPSKTVFLSWPAILWFYVKVLFWPVRSRAFADPVLADSFSLHDVLFPALGVCCAAAILAAVCGWAWKKARRDFPDREALDIERALLLGVLLLVLPILLTLNINALNPGDFLHGRYTYLPLAGLMLLLAVCWHVAEKSRAALLATAGLVAIVFGVLTIHQENLWKDDLTVFTVAHQLAPSNAPVAQSLVRAHVQVALSFDEAGQCDKAMPIFDDAIRQYPQDWYAWAGQGECYFKMDDLPKAEQSLRRAAELTHEPRVNEEWQLVREKMGLPIASPQ